ncbi:hypothetical protein V8E55_010338 [Tylopilus felleus]
MTDREAQDQQDPSDLLCQCPLWIIAFTRTIQATTYALLPQRREDLSYQNFISSLFTSIQPLYHKHIIQLDKAICL